MEKRNGWFGNLMNVLFKYPTRDSSQKDGEKTNSKSEKSSTQQEIEWGPRHNSNNGVSTPTPKPPVGVPSSVSKPAYPPVKYASGGPIHYSTGAGSNLGPKTTSQVRDMLSGMPSWLVRTAIFARKKGGGLLESSSPPSVFNDPNALEEVTIGDAQLMTAQIKGTNSYRLMLDLDVTHQYYRSSSGNGHLVIDVSLSREEHDMLMETLASVGVLQTGFAQAAKIKKQGASLRLPWVKKGEDKSWNEQQV